MSLEDYNRTGPGHFYPRELDDVGVKMVEVLSLALALVLGAFATAAAFMSISEARRANELARRANELAGRANELAGRALEAAERANQIGVRANVIAFNQPNLEGVLVCEPEAISFSLKNIGQRPINITKLFVEIVGGQTIRVLGLYSLLDFLVDHGIHECLGITIEATRRPQLGRVTPALTAIRAEETELVFSIRPSDFEMEGGFSAGIQMSIMGFLQKFAFIVVTKDAAEEFEKAVHVPIVNYHGSNARVLEGNAAVVYIVEHRPDDQEFRDAFNISSPV